MCVYVCVCLFMPCQIFNVSFNRFFLPVLYGEEVAIRDTMNQFNSLYSRIIYPFSPLHERFHGYVGYEKI